jgi:hypothetical protein
MGISRRTLNGRNDMPDNTENTTETTVEEGKETSASTETATEESKETTSTETATDVKAEAQKIADAMVARKLKGMPTKEEIKAFKEWQDSQKTEEQKTNDKISEAEKAKTAAELRAVELEAKVSALSQGVKSDSVDDVVALAQRLVTDDVTVEDAIKQVVKKYPQFASETTKESKPNVTTSTQTSQNTDTDDAALRRAFGLK